MDDPLYEIGAPANGIVDVKCQSLLGFMSYVDAYHYNTHGLAYRGQFQDWPLESKLLRETKAQLKRDNPNWSESDLVRVSEINTCDEGGRIMQVYGAHLANSPNAPATDQQAWMIGRHQGLLTPFIDWSKSPYVAAFFAVVEVVERGLVESDGECVVYAISSWLFPMTLEKRTLDNGPLKRWALQVDAAFYGNPRGIAQRGIASYVYPQCDLETFIRETEPEDSQRRNLYKIRLPFSCAERALVHLNRMNVNYLSLFPDSFGLARDANLNLYSASYSGAGNWAKPPGFDTLIPDQKSGG